MELEEILERIEKWKKLYMDKTIERHEPLKPIPDKDLPGSFYAKGKVSIVSAEDLTDLKKKGYTVEEVLHHLVTTYDCLLHGSRLELDQYITPDKVVHATDNAGIAMSKAIISKQSLPINGVEYYFSGDRLISVTLNDAFEDTVADSGYVYVIPDRTGFKKISERGYVKRENTDFMTRVEIVRDDLRINDMTL